ncbi:MAG: HAD family hydrolase [Ktedonobacterales bacterium]
MSHSPLYLPYPQSIRAVFFDVGYTLLAPHPSVVDIVAAYCADHNLPVESACIEEHLPEAEIELRRLVRDDPFTWSDDQAITSVWIAYFTALLRPCLPDMGSDALAHHVEMLQRIFDSAASYALYPDVMPVLETLSTRNLTLGVISDWGIGLGLILRHHDLVRYFTFAVISAALRMAKPDPELFATALRRADAIPDYALHIGDSYTLDVLGARAAGITPVLLDRNGRIDPAAMDCLVVRDLYGLLDALEIPRL